MKQKMFFLIGSLVVLSVFVFPQQSVAEVPTATPTLSMSDAVNTAVVGTDTVDTESGPGFLLSLDIPDTQETRKVIKVIEKSYDVQAKAAYTFDLSKLHTVFINDSRFPVTPDTLETIRQLTRNPSLESAGWLDYKIAYYSWVRDSILLFESVHAKAKADNRDLTKEERNSLIDPWGRVAPARTSGFIRKTPITYLTLDITNDIATVTLLRDAYHSKLSLVLFDGEWYVANETFLSITP